MAVRPFFPAMMLQQMPLNVVLPETQNQTDGSATIRGATTPSVKVILNIRQPGSETNKTQTIVKYFTVVSSAAEITFKNLPTGLIIAKLQIENGNIQGWKNLHGATDLVSGSNNLDVSPAGSKLKADLLASALQNAITNDKLMAAGGSNMATNLANALATVDTNTVNPYNTVLNLLIDQVNPTGIVKVQFDNTTDTLTAFDGATQLWQKSYTATEILGTEAIAGIDSSAFQAVRIVQQGFDDYFAIEWRDSSTIVSLITTHNPTTAQWQSLFINKGIFDQIVKISDSDYIIGGFDAIANRPGIWKWNINNNAFANSVTDGSTNLDWEISFSELAYSTMSTNGKVIENLMYDGQGNINAVVKTEDGESKTYLLSLSDGSKTDITPPDFSIDTILTLSYPGSVYAYSSSLEKIKLNLPVNNETAKYALVVVNTSGTSQTIKINPESYVTSRRAEQVNSLRANVLTPQPPNDLAWRYANQTRLQNNMRKKIGLRRSSLTNGAKASMQIRASDNSSEYEGQIKTLYTVSKSYGDGGPMIPRECKLVKIGQYCKIFVDQEEYQGLSAIDGDYKVTDADVEHFATEFDTRIYDLLTNSYAPVYDFDNDGKFTILISPVYAKLGFAGLFNTIHLTPAEYAGTGSNQRDMVGIWSPNEGTSGFQWTGETWREATRETIAHEMQHAANYSAKFWSTGTYNRSAQMEEVWLDEGLSVGVEARYRVMRGDPAGENRFDYWAENPSSTNLTQFSTIFNPFFELRHERSF
jgi:hypothetical protein